MKKLLMFAAAMTIVGGAFAQCGDSPVVTQACAMVYDVKMSVKTTVGKPIAGRVLESNCGDSEEIGAVCYRTKGSMSLQGYIESCTCDCEGLMDGVLNLWNKKAKTYEVVEGAFSWMFINIMGKKNTETEGSWVLPLDGIGLLGGGVLYGSGFGNWNSKECRVDSMSGNFAGFVSAPLCDSDITCDAAIAYPCACIVPGTEDELPTVAFGTWSIKYNKKLSKKLAEGGSFVLPYPDFL